MGCINKRPDTWGNFTSGSLANGVHKDDKRADIGYCSLILIAPTNLIVSNPLTAEGVERVDALKLDWTSSSLDNETGIERSVDGIVFAQIDTVAAGLDTYLNESLTYNETWFYRVRALGANPSGYSNIDSGTVATNPLIFTSNLHAWFRGDKYILASMISGRVSQWTDISGNSRHITQTNTIDQPRTTAIAGGGGIDGHPAMRYFTSSGDDTFFENITNWSGLGTDDYFAVVIAKGDVNSIIFNRSDAADSGFWSSAHQQVKAGTYADGLFGKIGAGAPSARIPSNDSDYHFAVYHMGGDIEGIWYDGQFDDRSTIYNTPVTESFDTVRFGRGRVSNISDPRGISQEIMLISGKPSDYPTLFSDLHNIYGVTEYPSRSIQDPFVFATQTRAVSQSGIIDGAELDIQVSWAATESGLLNGYEVEKSLDGSSWDTPVSIGVGESVIHRFVGLAPTTLYYFRVRELGVVPNSYSNIDTATTSS